LTAAERLAPFLELDPTAEAPESWVARVCRALRAGSILAHPTTSVYGIGGAVAESAVRVSTMKRRAGSIPILRLVLDAQRLRDLHPEIRWNAEAERLANAFWPGPLTLVLDDGTDSGIAVRAEAHPLTRRLLQVFDGEIGSTSLNLSGELPATTVSEARRVLGAMADPGVEVLLLSGGDLPGPPTSTLVSLRGEHPHLLRTGAVSRSVIEAALGAELEG